MNMDGFYTQAQIHRAVEKYSIASNFQASGLSKKAYALREGMHRTTLQRHLKLAAKGALGLVDGRRANHRQSREMSDPMAAWVLAYIADHPAVSVTSLRKHLAKAIEEKGWLEQVPSYGRLLKFYRNISPDVLKAFREGDKARAEEMGVTARRRFERLQERYETDWVTLDVWTFDPRCGPELFRPMLVSIVECHSRAVAATLICKTVGAREILLTLKRAILGNSPHDAYIVRGIPKEIGLDNGTPYLGDVLEAMTGLSINPNFSAKSSPEQQGIQERFFRSLQEDLTVSLRGYTKQARGKDRAERRAIPYPLLQKLVDDWILGYHTRPHRGLRKENRNLSPWEAWHEGADDAHGLVFDPAEVDRLVRMTVERKIQHDGVHLENLIFTSPDFEGVVDQSITLYVPPEGFNSETKLWGRLADGRRVESIVCQGGTGLSQKLREARLERTKDIRELRKDLRLASQAWTDQQGAIKPYGEVPAMEGAAVPPPRSPLAPTEPLLQQEIAPRPLGEVPDLGKPEPRLQPLDMNKPEEA